MPKLPLDTSLAVTIPADPLRTLLKFQIEGTGIPYSYGTSFVENDSLQAFPGTDYVYEGNACKGAFTFAPGLGTIRYVTQQ